MNLQFPLRPTAASEHAVLYDQLFFTITGLTVFFTTIVGIMVLFLALRYRRGARVDRSNAPDHNTKLELVLLGVPLLLGLGIFTWSALLFVRQRTMPEDGLEVFVIGKQWMWHLQHMNGVRENNELHVPVGVPIKLTMISQDVIHSMYLPEFRAQYHVVPGRYTQLQFTPTRTGTFRMLCAMHCGTQHSEMVGIVRVLSKEDYAKWIGMGGNRFRPIPQTMAAAGRQVFELKNCGNCHGDVNTERAPSLRGLIGRERVFRDGSSVVADHDYIRESTVDPYRRVVAGYEETMPAYKGNLTEEQILELIAYISTLGQTMPENAPLAPHEQPVKPTAPAPSGNKNAADIANERESAGATQFQKLRSRP